MADLKISALTAATTPLAGTEVLPIVQGGVTTKVSVSDLTAGRAVTATSVNKVAITAPATASTLTIADGKTLAVNDNATLGTGGLTLGNSGGFTAAASKVLTASNSLTLAGTDATTQTFPTTSATIARTDAAQTFTGDQVFNGTVQIGPSGPAIFCKIFSNTTNVADGGSRFINHGIDYAKIVDWECLVGGPDTTFGWFKRNFTKYGGYQFEAWMDATQLTVSLTAGNCSGILNTPIRFTIWYTA